MAVVNHNSLLDYICIVLRRIIPAKWYLSFRYYLSFRRLIDWKNPRTFSEKLQWLKIYGDSKAYSTLVDKVKVKDFVSERIGGQYIIPTLRVWDSPDEIDFDELPDQFVLKCNHASGDAIVCRDKNELDLEDVRKRLKRSLKYNYYLRGMETPYKFVQKKIFAEKYMHDERTNDLIDYKFFCFSGVPKVMLITSNRSEGLNIDYFDMEFRHLPIRLEYPNASGELERPDNFDLMKKLASKLAAGLPHVRVDLYEINGKVYFGEMTFFTGSGLMHMEPESWDEVFGSWLELPVKN